MNKNSIGMEILSDEEFYAMRDKAEKERFLDNLLSASESSTRKMGFSVKSLQKKDDASPAKPTTNSNLKNSSVFRKAAYEQGAFDDDRWNALLEKMEETEPSPIEDVTDYEIRDFGKRALETLGPEADDDDDNSPSKYNTMYKKELAMYAEILKDVSSQARTVSAKLKAMGSKGSYGVSKGYSDLMEQYNSLNNTKMNIVKNMADLKTKTEDFKLKKMKEIGEDGEQGVDELVDQYYKTIMNGGRAEFMNRSLLSQSPYDTDRNTYQDIVSGDYELPDGETIPKAGWNITQPIPDDMVGDMNTGLDVDKYGYIRNEDREPEVCIQRSEDGSLQFIAIGKDGLEVEDYALPGEDLLENISIKPMSNFAYDKYGRKYSIIDVSTSGVDLSDLDDDDYQYG